MLNWLRNLFRSDPWEKTGEFTHPRYRLRGDLAPASERGPCVTAASGRSLVVTGPKYSSFLARDVWYVGPEGGVGQLPFFSDAEARAYAAKGMWSVQPPPRQESVPMLEQQRQMPARPMALRSRVAWSVQPTKESK